MQRLAAICAAEHVSVDTAALHTLVQRTDGDIRAAINTLQLLARQNQAPGGGAVAGTPARGAARTTRITQKQVGGFKQGVEVLTSSSPCLLQPLLVIAVWQMGGVFG